MSYPESVWYFSSIAMTPFREDKDAFANIIISSANAKWVIQGQPKKTLNPKYVSCSTNLFKPQDKTYAQIMNKDGDNGSPCRRPLVDVKNPKLAPLTINENQTLKINLQILSMKHSPKPNCRNTLIMKNQETLSHTFVISNLITTLPPLNFLPMFAMISWNHSTKEKLFVKELLQGELLGSLIPPY